MAAIPSQPAARNRQREDDQPDEGPEDPDEGQDPLAGDLAADRLDARVDRFDFRPANGADQFFRVVAVCPVAGAAPGPEVNKVAGPRIDP